MYFKKFAILSGVALATILWQSEPAESQIVRDGLLSYWTFDASDVTGQTAKDAWGDRDGTIISHVWAAPGKIGEALAFTPGGRIEFDVSGLPQGSAPRTMGAWVKPEGGGTRTVVEYGTNADRQRCGILVLGSQVVYFVGQNADAQSNGTVPNGEWHYVATAYDGTTMRIYIDGAMDKEQAVSIETVLNIGRIGTNVRDGELYEGSIDEVCIYDRALTDEEVAQNFSATRGLVLTHAGVVTPVNGARDIPRDGTVLRWRAGSSAVSHRVYFGEDPEAVGSATADSDEFKGNQTDMIYALGRLDLGQTYYWRIDEVNDAHPDSPWKGDVWSFTTEPTGYPLGIAQIVATASSINSEEEHSENVINGSGLDANGMHSATVADMWLTSMTDEDPWIEFTFDQPYLLREMVVWNHNSALEPDVGFGIREATVEYSLDRTEWISLDPVEFAQASGQEGDGANSTISFDGTVAQYVRIVPISNWGGVLPQYGLSEVRFLYVPVWAREAEPATGRTGVAPDVTLDWRSGRQAATHQVYLSDDEAAVVEGTVPVVQVTEPSYQPDPLHLGRTYYWRVDEVNEVEDPSVWQGDVWNFTVRDVIVVEDFEAYTDDMEAGEAIFQTWIDGVENETGSFVGYEQSISGTFGEVVIVHGGRQAMPLFYDNTTGAAESVTTRTFAGAHDWTQSGIQGLVMYFQGSTENTGGQLYVQINDTKVPYDGDPENLTRAVWSKWYIELNKLDAADLEEVTSLGIGIDSGGQGVVYVDDMILTAETRRLVTPTEPDSVGLVAHWAMDEGPDATTLVDSAGGDNNATVVSGTTGVPGRFGNAIQIGGADDPITAPDVGLPAGTAPCTISAWFQQTSEFINGDGVFVSYGTTGAESGVSGQYRALAKNNARAYRVFHWDADMAPGTAASPAAPDVWHHVAFTFDKEANTQAVYLNGILIGTDVIPDNADVVLNGRVIIGDMDVYTQIFNGLLDELRIYARALSADEIAWLSGRTMPFDE
jgi:hypothetical protein